MDTIEIETGTRAVTMTTAIFNSNLTKWVQLTAMAPPNEYTVVDISATLLREVVEKVATAQWPDPRTRIRKKGELRGQLTMANLSRYLSAELVSKATSYDSTAYLQLRVEFDLHREHVTWFDESRPVHTSQRVIDSLA